MLLCSQRFIISSVTKKNVQQILKNNHKNYFVQLRKLNQSINNNNFSIKWYFDNIHTPSLQNPTEFWKKASEQIHWFESPKHILSTDSKGTYKWFEGGTLNTAYNCLDVHIKNGLGDNIALIWESPLSKSEKKYTYKELHNDVTKMAGGLKQLGIEKGDVVVIYLPMIPEAIISMLACARIGAVHSVVFGGFAPQELATRVDDAKPKVLITARYGVEVQKILPYKPLVDTMIGLATHKLQNVIVVDRTDFQCDCIMVEGRDIWWNKLINNSTPFTDVIPVQATDSLYCLYTSGTTGKPKGVVRENGGHAVVLKWAMENIMNTRAGEIYWAASDVGWVVGHSFIVYGPLLTGCTTVLFEGKPVGTPDAGIFWRLIQKHKIKTLFTAPTAVRAIIKEDPHYKLLSECDISSLKAIFVAGERMDVSTLHWLEHAVPKAHILDNWWQTETGWPCVANPIGIEVLPVKPGSPTVPMPGYDIKAMDDDGNILPPNTQGNLVFKLPLPPCCFSTLWNDHKRYDAYMKRFPGYYETGDGGYVDSDGYVFVSGRTDDVINCAGHRFSSAMLEEVAGSVAGVAECAVIGVPDHLKGDIPVAFFVPVSDNLTPQKSAQSIVREVREKIGAVASLKIAIPVNKLPKTRSGKILRGSIRSLCSQESIKIPSTIDDPSTLQSIRDILDLNIIGPVAIDKANKRWINVVQERFENGTFKALVALHTHHNKHVQVDFKSMTVDQVPCPDMTANVVVEVHYSTLNYKDGMALVGKKGIVNRYPIIPGIDYSGVVLDSIDPKFKKGDEIILTGHNAGQLVDGGYSQVVRVKSNWIVPLSVTNFSLWEAMAIGTAGFTAMQSIIHLERSGALQRGDTGNVLVTGASGGVGSFAVAILSNLGYNVVASTGREFLHSYLTDLGSKTVIGRIGKHSHHLEPERWIAAIDCVGGDVLSSVIASTRTNGAVACCGLSGGSEFKGSLYPFILRGVKLLGIESGKMDEQERLEIWKRLSTDFPKNLFKVIAQEKPLKDIPHLAESILSGHVQGRIFVNVKDA